MRDQPLEVGHDLSCRAGELVEGQHLNPVKVPVEAPERLALVLVNVAADDDLGPDLVRVLVVTEPDLVATCIDLLQYFCTWPTTVERAAPA